MFWSRSKNFRGQIQKNIIYSCNINNLIFKDLTRNMKYIWVREHLFQKNIFCSTNVNIPAPLVGIFKGNKKIFNYSISENSSLLWSLIGIRWQQRVDSTLLISSCYILTLFKGNMTRLYFSIVSQAWKFFPCLGFTFLNLATKTRLLSKYY